MQITNPDSLIQEIDDDLARKRMEALWRKYAPFVLGGALLIVAATAGATLWKHRTTQNEQATTKALIEAVAQEDAQTGDPGHTLKTFAQSHQGTVAATLAAFGAAAKAFESGQQDEGLALLDALSSDRKLSPLYRQLADLLWTQTQLDSAAPEALQARLAPLMQADGPWRFSAYELAVYLALRLEDREGAKRKLGELIAMPALPSSIAERARDVSQWLNDQEGR